jgi:NADH-quinone oxidoreductase subunit H
MNLGMALLATLIFPGLVYALPAGWFMRWLERKAEARFQRRIGPPFFQPFFDFIKLLSKTGVPRRGLNGSLMSFWPVLAAASLTGALALLPVFPKTGGFAGDLVLLVALLELPSICTVLAGFTSGSVFGEIGSVREAVLSITYNVAFLMAVFAIAVDAHTLQLSVLAEAPFSVGRGLALLAILLCLPAKLRLNPFSQPNAEQEIYSGSLTEYGGPQLGVWELSHSLEWVALTGLFASLVPAHTGIWFIDAFLFVAISVVLVCVLAMFAAGTARLKIAQAVRFYSRWGFAIGAVALIAAYVLPGRGL